MSEYKVKVKWGKEKYEGVDLDANEPPILFKNVLFSLTGVSPDRQKVMIKGQTIKDDDWGKVKFANGMTFLMMGTVGELPVAPKEKTVFVEDMTESELATAMEMPAGLKNLGNTCYMNSTLQCLKSVSELREGLAKYTGDLGSLVPSQLAAAAMRDLFRDMDRYPEGYPPVLMLTILQKIYPHYAEKGENGIFKQQDANELWTQLVRLLSERLPGKKAEESGTPASEDLVHQHFGIEVSSTLKCDEAPDEADSAGKEKLFQLGCYISHEVKYMETGIKSRLRETITKLSPSLGRDTEYIKTSLISRLPAYLTIQFVRFFYKEKEQVNAKILKDVKFPLKLDVFDLCAPELQHRLAPARKRIIEYEEKQAMEAKIAAAMKEGTKTETPMETDQPEAEYEPHHFADDVGSSNSGLYDLHAVLTHKGRSSSSGHYVAWVRKSGPYWLMFDDDDVSAVHEEDVLKLSGGGDWHTAYVLLYAPRRVPKRGDDA